METERLLQENPAYRAWWHLARAYNAMSGLLDRFFEDWGITGAQFGVLRCTSDAGPEGLMLSDLSKRLMVTCGNITGVVDRLEQAGLLRRERCAEDRRVVRAQLTPEGRELYQRVMPAFQELLIQIMSPLPMEEREELSGLSAQFELAIDQFRQDGAARPVAVGGALDD